MRRGGTCVGLLLAALAVAPVGCRSTQSDVDQPGLRVRPPVAFEMLSDAPYMPVLDVRREDEFLGPLGHLRRAKNVPLTELEQRFPEIEYLKDLTFLVYCRGWDGCGEEAMKVLLGAGYQDAVLLEGGVEAWLRDGFGTVGGLLEETPMPEDSGLRIPTDVEGGGDEDLLPEPP